MREVAALYVMPDGPYPRLVREWYDETRDAKKYSGEHAVVVHPPCGPWGSLRFMCYLQDPTCGPHAVDVVRRNGGVLEHPADSQLFKHCGMPKPGESPDQWGGRTYLLRQVSWGHTCAKPTWIYCVRVPHWLARSVFARSGGIATRRVTSGPRGPQLPTATKRARTVTPTLFAQALVALAGMSR